jgi:hypothetical protein
MAKVVVKNSPAAVTGVRPSTLKRGKLVKIIDRRSILNGKLGMTGPDGIVCTFGGGIADEDYLVEVLPKGATVEVTQR